MIILQNWPRFYHFESDEIYGLRQNSKEREMGSGSNLDSEEAVRQRSERVRDSRRDPRLSIQHATPGAVPGRNNNFLKSDEIGPKGREWKGQPRNAVYWLLEGSFYARHIVAK